MQREEGARKKKKRKERRMEEEAPLLLAPFVTKFNPLIYDYWPCVPPSRLITQLIR